ncbi:MAG: hypothetical protein IPL06_06470 [Betaproteobacteria bacterium]|nr:hypothetical protein [Betaproteobacteria bacterium]
MNKLGYLDTLHSVAIAVVVAGVIVGWAGHTAQQVRSLPDGDVAITDDGRMKVTVTAERLEAPSARTASAPPMARQI